MEFLPISNRVFNRQSVQSAIRSTQQRLKRYNHNTFPTNGLVIFCGLAGGGGGAKNNKERLVTVDIEPFHPIKSFTYLCDKRFHTDVLRNLCIDDENEPAYGFIVIDGKGVLFGLLRGTNRQVLQRFNVDLPNKTRRGGQSALRFDRIRKEKRDLYVGKVAESAIEHFVGADNRPRVKGIVLAGQAGCKDDLLNHKVFHKRLRHLVVQSLDVAYGGLVGLDSAIDQSAAALGSAKLLQEKVLLERYLEEMSRDTGKYCLSVRDTLAALDMGAVEDLIVWDGLETTRYEVVDKTTGEETVLFHSALEEEEPNADAGIEVIKKESLLDWICDHHKEFGCRLSLVSDRTAAGRQFTQGLGGIGALLRWRIDFQEFQHSENTDDDDAADEYSFGEGESSSNVLDDDGDFVF